VEWLIPQADDDMTTWEKTLVKVLRGASDANIGFDDLRRMLEHLGFVERVRGDHHVFWREGVVEILNLQPRNHQAKAYQVRQVREVIVRYHLAGGDDA
jgi:hypothetical protein